MPIVHLACGHSPGGKQSPVHRSLAEHLARSGVAVLIPDNGCDAFSGICPKSPQELRERRQDERFRALQKRRAQTEGRVGILKNKFLGKLVKAKGYANRAMAIHWAVLAHNLWVLARLESVEESQSTAQRPKAA